MLSNNALRILAKVFQTIAAQEISLSNNKLQEIESYSFTACKRFLRNVYLHSNHIRYISPSSFKGIKYISSVSLSRNKINTIHPETFKHVYITTDVRQPWTNPQDCYFEYLIIRFDYLIIRFDYLITG